MSFLKNVGVALLVFLILGGIFVSLFSLNMEHSSKRLLPISFLKNVFKDPLQATLFVIMALLVVLFLVFLFARSNTEEEEPEELLEQLHPEHIHPTDYVDEEAITVTYPTLNFETQQPLVEAINENIASTPNEPEFKRFLKNTILELEREKARIYHEVALLDEDYRKGILTETEFLTGIQLILEDQGLEETIEEKDQQIEECKAKLAESGIRKTKKKED